MATEQDRKIEQLIEGCIDNDRKSQKDLYRHFYALAMGICLRYTNNKEDAAGIMNDGFYKVFTNIHTYDRDRPFVVWLRRIMNNTAIDHYRASLRFSSSFPEADAMDSVEYGFDNVLDGLYYNDLLEMIRSLTPAYRTVFSLYAIEGYSHEEIAQTLDISIGTSKSNLFKARAKLAGMVRSFERSRPKKSENGGQR